jgi:hypothetical protein
VRIANAVRRSQTATRRVEYALFRFFVQLAKKIPAQNQDIFFKQDLDLDPN